MVNRRQVLQALSLATLSSILCPGASFAGLVPPTLRPQVGPRNLITDVPGLQVGMAQDEHARTGTTVILAHQPAVAAVDVRGGGPATRETDVLREENLVQTIDAIVLSGGSVYGLAAADGVSEYLGQHGRGFALQPTPGIPASPIVPAACLYDLSNGGNKQQPLHSLYKQLGITAIMQASDYFSLGTVGAGYGAMTEMGKLKGGLGSASILTSDNATIGAIVAVNSLGSVRATNTRAFWATPYEIGNEFGGGGREALAQLRAQDSDWPSEQLPNERKNTTIACIATDISLTRVELKRIAIMAQAGMARAIRPIHSPYDGDVVFAISTGKREVNNNNRELTVLQTGTLAADTLARAIARGVYAATAWPDTQVRTWKNLPR